MSDPVNEVSGGENPPVELQPVACESGCGGQRSILWRALLYTPLLLLSSAMAAVAMFPNLAEFAAPILGKQAGHSCMRSSGISEGCCSHDEAGCCSMADKLLASQVKVLKSGPAEACSGQCPLHTAGVATELNASTPDSLTEIPELPADESAFFTEAAEPAGESE